MRYRLIAATSALAFTVLAGHANAQRADAEALFSEGEKLMKGGQLAPACDAFEASNRLEPRAGTLIRLGACREQNRQFASARAAYKDALSRAKDRTKKEIARGRLAEIDHKVSYLTISIADDNRIDGLTLTRNGQPLDPALWNRRVPVDGGDYLITGQAPGHDEWRASVTVPLESGDITIEVPKLDEITEPVRPVATAPPATLDVTETRITRQTSIWTRRRKIAIATLGGSAAALTAGVVFGTQASNRHDAASALCNDPRVSCEHAERANDLVDDGKRLALRANIAYGVAAAMAIGAGALWFTGAPEARTSRVAIVPALAPGEAGVIVVRTF